MAGAISFNGNSSFGNFNLQASTAANILVNSGAVLSSANGNLTLQGNPQGTTTSGNFTGVTVNGSVQSTGTGLITVQGQGVSATSQAFGVLMPKYRGHPWGYRKRRDFRLRGLVILLWL